MPWTLVQLQHRTPETPGRQQTSYEQPNQAIQATSSYLACPPAVKTLPPWSWKALLDGHCTLGCAAYLTASSSSDQGKGQAEHHQHQHQQQNQRGKARQGKAPLDQTEREAFPTLDKTDFVKAVPGSPSWIWPWDIGSRA
ncbi:hypothetical protein CABS03_02659 [Colletotrichum abscissum]|uniref:Uncharacterized protein n=1 Tax=Colletotrichum abscissum TaxID=1671311 RepID=A0A9Q0AU25_9PEZI|nr:hypothetical protein CABS02_13880 [Colletotrichum abscissum]